MFHNKISEYYIIKKGSQHPITSQLVPIHYTIRNDGHHHKPSIYTIVLRYLSITWSLKFLTYFFSLNAHHFNNKKL